MLKGSRLERLEAIADDESVSAHLAGIETRLPVGVRRRQLSVRTLVLGILLCIADDRPAHLRRVARALVSLPEADQRRLGIVVAERCGWHRLTYRQVERTFSLVRQALCATVRDGRPSASLQALVDVLVEASVPQAQKNSSTSLAIDWSDQETFARPPHGEGDQTADPEASWGHRHADHPGDGHELFFGYFFSLATMVNDEGGPPVAEFARRLLVTSCRVDPVPAFVSVIETMAEGGVAIGDVLCDSGYAHRLPEHFALPLRAIGGRLVMDLHPHDRGTQGTFQGAISHNGNLDCPATPPPLLSIGPLSRSAGPSEVAAHDVSTAELARFKFGRHSGTDHDGYHRVVCPAVAGKVRCPLRSASMLLDYTRPEIHTPPTDAPRCCTKITLSVPPSVNAKTAQKHDYPSAQHRRSYARRSAAERANATLKDPATTDVGRGWCRLMGLTAITVLLAGAVVVRNLWVADAFEARMAAPLPTRARRRRRTTIADLVKGT